MDQCEDKINRICVNINKKGLQRYDPRDIDEMVQKIPGVLPVKYRGKILQGVEILAPRLIRKCFKINPTNFPTTYTFLAEAYYKAYQSQNRLPLRYSDFDLMEECLNIYSGKNGKWSYKENKKFYVAKDGFVKEPTMHLYGLSRCNNLLARMGVFYNREDYVQISAASLRNMLKQHTIFDYENGAKSISYYYNSNDCTLNVNTEVADWISQLPEQYVDKNIYSIFEGIIKLILTEQNEDGSWYYFSKEHMKKYETKETIDCHHSATVLYNLIHVLESGKIAKEEQNLIDAISRGMNYFSDMFFDIKTGKGITILGKKRKASSMQYSEALVAMCEFVNCAKFEQGELKEKCKRLIPQVVKQLLKLVEKDGSAPGDCKIVPINLDSINWGNGAVLWALVHYKYSFLGVHHEEK